MLTTYDEIELFGLTENGSDDLPLPNDDELQGRAVGEAFEALIGTLQGTGLASEVEPLAHAFATMLQRRAVSLDQAADRQKVKARSLIGSQDGSEIAEQELDETTRLFTILAGEGRRAETHGRGSRAALRDRDGRALHPRYRRPHHAPRDGDRRSL